MKQARIALLCMMASALIALAFNESPIVGYQGTYLDPNNNSPLFTLTENGNGVIHSDMYQGLRRGGIQWRHSEDMQGLELRQGEVAINVLTVSNAKELGFQMPGKGNDLLQIIKNGNTTSFKHITSRVNTDSVSYKIQAASLDH